MEVMSRNEFKKNYVDRLEKKFGYKFYWNGKESKEKGFNCDGNFYGMSYSDSKDRPIVLRYRKHSSIEMFDVLIHEFAHSYLHYKSTLDKSIKEIEAETVSMLVFIELKLKCNRIDEYLSKYKASYRKKYGKEFTFNKEKENSLKDLAKEISSLFKGDSLALERLGETTDSKNKITRTKKEPRYIVVCKHCCKVICTRTTLEGAKSTCKKFICSKCKSKLEYDNISKKDQYKHD